MSDLFVLRNSDELAEWLANCNPGSCNVFSVDVRDLYYNIPHDELMKSVKLSITEDNDELKFCGSAGISVSSFLQILSFT